MGKHTETKIASVWATCLALFALGSAFGLTACTSSDFGGGGASFGANLRGKGDAADGADGEDGTPDSGTDSDADGADNGASDTDGDSDGDGNDSDGDADGGMDSDDDSGDDDGVGDDDDSIDPDKNPGDLAESDDETKAKYLHDATINRTKEDESFRLQVDTLIGGEVVQTNTLSFGDKGQAKGGGVIKNACRNKKNTCLKLTFIGKETQIVGSSSCTKVLSNTGTTAKIFADTNGEGIFGSCLEGDDEEVVITCPDSKSLKVANCNG